MTVTAGEDAPERRRDGAGLQAGSMPSPIAVGSAAPPFSLHDSPHSRIELADFRGRTVVLVFHVADWHPVATAQLEQLAAFHRELDALGAAVLGISSDATWSHAAYAASLQLPFPLLADDSPPASVAAAYGVRAPGSIRSARALVVIDRDGRVAMAARYPEAVNPGVDPLLSVLEGLASGQPGG